MGHAIEVRIYAEDPKNFFPSPGRITKLTLPSGENIRHELAVNEQSTVTPFYDPMIAKLIVKGSKREKAIEEMKRALENYVVEGIKTNILMLRNVVAYEAFLKDDTTTNFIVQYLQSKSPAL